MQIIWKGQSCFQIISQQGKNNQVFIVIDPFDETIGLRVPKWEADILLISHSHSDHNNKKAVSGSPFIIDGPGEYEIKGVFILALPSFALQNLGGQGIHKTNTIYVIEAEEMRLCHLGMFQQKELSADQLERTGAVDILMIPVGGIYTIDSKTAAKVISQIEPKIVIPMHYQIPGLKVHPVKSCETGISPKAKSFNGVKLEGLDKFLKVMGTKSIEPQNKFTVKKKDLPQEGIKIIVLRP